MVKRFSYLEPGMVLAAVAATGTPWLNESAAAWSDENGQAWSS